MSFQCIFNLWSASLGYAKYGCLLMIISMLTTVIDGYFCLDESFFQKTFKDDYFRRFLKIKPSTAIIFWRFSQNIQDISTYTQKQDQGSKLHWHMHYINSIMSFQCIFNLWSALGCFKNRIFHTIASTINGELWT